MELLILSPEMPTRLTAEAHQQSAVAGELKSQNNLIIFSEYKAVNSTIESIGMVEIVLFFFLDSLIFVVGGSILQWQ